MNYFIPNPSRSYAQSPGTIPGGSTISHEIAQVVQEFPDRVAVIDDYGMITYRQLWETSTIWVARLLSHGVKPGGRVAALIPNRRDFVVVSLATFRLGAALVPLPTNYRAQEVETILSHAEPEVVVVCGHFFSDDVFNAIQEALGRVGSHPHLLLSSDEESLADLSIVSSLPEPEPDTLSAIIYTSGTTGVPKGVMHSHEGIVRMARASNAMRQVEGQEMWLCLIPLSHAFGLEYGLPCPLFTGGTLILTDAFDPARTLTMIAHYRVSYLVAVPTMMIRMLSLLTTQTDVSTVRNVYLGAMAAPPDMMQAISEQFGCTITTTYGASEFGHATMTQLGDSLNTVSMTSGGPIYGGVEIRIMHGDKTAPMGEVGQIWVRGPMTFQGYFHDDVHTHAARRSGGWVSVEDLGFLSAEGRLTVVGRLKDMIVRGGQNIYPNEIEAILQRHPAVLLSSVVAIPDAEMGERTCACIILKQFAPQLHRSDLLSVFSQVARYKVPDYVLAFTEFPQTSTGKVRKDHLQRLAINQLLP